MPIDVSIVVPAYNAAVTLPRAITSIHQQGEDLDLEVLVIDDHSTDETMAVANSLSDLDSRIRVLQTPKNLGAAGSRNIGIELARGSYLAFLDADDVWLPHKLTKQVTRLEEKQDCILVSCDSLKVRPDGAVLTRAHLNKTPKPGTSAWKTLLHYNFIPTPTVLTLTSTVRQLGGFDESLAVGEDLDMWISLAKLGDVQVLDEVLVHYFDYSDSLMKRHGAKSSLAILEMIERHMEGEQRLTDDERRKILAGRHFELAVQCLNFGEYGTALEHFKIAETNGGPRRTIRKLLAKYRIKQLLRPE